jgi:hypothetical protein
MSDPTALRQSLSRLSLHIADLDASLAFGDWTPADLARLDALCAQAQRRARILAMGHLADQLVQP